MKIHYQLTAAEFSKGSSDGQILFIKKQKKVSVLRWVITILLIAFYSIFFVLFYKQHSRVLNLLAALANTIFLAMAVMNISASALHLLFGDSSLPDLFYSDGFLS